MHYVHRSNKMREGRYSEDGQIYLLTTVVSNRAPVFLDLRLGWLVVEQFKLAQEEGAADSLAWVIMPDHFHWLIQLKSGTLGELMCRAKSRSARALNVAVPNSQFRWQKGYHDRALRREENLQHLARYIIANPLRAGLVTRIKDYPLWDAVWL